MLKALGAFAPVYAGLLLVAAAAVAWRVVEALRAGQRAARQDVGTRSLCWRLEGPPPQTLATPPIPRLTVDHERAPPRRARVKRLATRNRRHA
jgi:hypothetical protein